MGTFRVLAAIAAALIVLQLFVPAESADPATGCHYKIANKRHPKYCSCKCQNPSYYGHHYCKICPSTCDGYKDRCKPVPGTARCMALPPFAGDNALPWPGNCKGMEVGSVCVTGCKDGMVGNVTTTCSAYKTTTPRHMDINPGLKAQWSAPIDSCVMDSPDVYPDVDGGVELEPITDEQIMRAYLIQREWLDLLNNWTIPKGGDPNLPTADCWEDAVTETVSVVTANECATFCVVNIPTGVNLSHIAFSNCAFARTTCRCFKQCTLKPGGYHVYGVVSQGLNGPLSAPGSPEPGIPPELSLLSYNTKCKEAAFEEYTTTLNDTYVFLEDCSYMCQSAGTRRAGANPQQSGAGTPLLLWSSCGSTSYCGCYQSCNRTLGEHMLFGIDTYFGQRTTPGGRKLLANKKFPMQAAAMPSRYFALVAPKQSDETFECDQRKWNTVTKSQGKTSMCSSFATIAVAEAAIRSKTNGAGNPPRFSEQYLHWCDSVGVPVGRRPNEAGWFTHEAVVLLDKIGAVDATCLGDGLVPVMPPYLKRSKPQILSCPDKNDRSVVNTCTYCATAKTDCRRTMFNFVNSTPGVPEDYFNRVQHQIQVRGAVVAFFRMYPNMQAELQLMHSKNTSFDAMEAVSLKRFDDKPLDSYTHAAAIVGYKLKKTIDEDKRYWIVKDSTRDFPKLWKMAMPDTPEKAIGFGIFIGGYNPRE